MKCYVIINRETGVIIKVVLNKQEAEDFVTEHNLNCSNYEQLFSFVEADMEVKYI